ncbi:MAG: ABC transporter permease [Elusimicrobia bacterium]|nr:ABC transporter permease [Candidatus Obscuribacterium magneticum]
MILNGRVLYAFLKRDARQTLSYRLAFFLDMASVFFNAATFYFVAKLIDAGPSHLFSNYGGSYFPFVIIGLAFSTYQSIGLNSFAQSLRQEQYLGTLESVLVNPINITTFLAGSALWDFLYTTLEVLLYFTLGVFVFGLVLPQAHILPALAALFLTISSFMGLGILAAAFILRFKKGNPVAWLIATASELLGGVYFPVQILPDWIKSISDWIPMTHALAALRQSLLNNAGFNEIGYNLIYLAGFTLVIWPVGIYVFKIALHRSQRDGTLGHY